MTATKSNEKSDGIDVISDEISDSSSAWSRIKIVLIGTTHPGNIGAAARAMKTMGLNRLSLVEPKHFPSTEADARAAGAIDLLETAECVEDLSAAVGGCGLVLGTTARERRLEWPVVTPREAAALAATQDHNVDIALVFGREHSGLSNEEIEQCDKLIRIPTDPEFGSLNLSHAVQICAYELRIALCDPKVSTDTVDDNDKPATNDAVNRLNAHWLEIMERVAYLHPDNPKLLPRRVRRLLNKAELTYAEAQIFRGFLRAVERRLLDIDEGK